MAKRKPIDTAPNDALLKSREKRKWQIALRRYVLEKNPCQFYAPYFGLDIENIRLWFQYQFPTGIGWDDFAIKWQFEHIIPVTYFDFSEVDDLKLCWSFVNIRVEYLKGNKDGGTRLDVLGARKYFRELYDSTGNTLALQLLHKLDQIELSEMLNTEGQQQFLREKAAYLNHIAGYSAFEFEMINRGRSLVDVEKEMNILKKFSN